MKMNAIILAGGHGSRMSAGNISIHKPLLPVQGLPNIERTIIMLKDFGIDDIIIVPGIYAESYLYLHEKYDCTIIKEPNASISTLYGISYVKDKIGDTFIIEGDVVLAENVFINKPYSYYYVMKYPVSEVDAWKPITNKEGRIMAFEIGSFTEPCIFGISFWSTKDAANIRDYITSISTLEYLTNPNIFWDDYIIEVLDRIEIFTYEITCDAATEMNNRDEYNFAIKLCEQYYANPDKYFLQLREHNIFFVFKTDDELAIQYVRKLLSDFNKKHPDNRVSLTETIKFKDNEYPFIIQSGNRSIGFIDLVLEDKVVFLRRIYIDEGWRNQAIGTEVVKKVIAFSKLTGKELRLNIYDYYVERFYNRLGFERNFINLVFRGN